MNILFSIIIPIYNTEKYLPHCIESVLNQNYSNYELILVNDGSKDNSLEICKKYAKQDSRIIIVNKENGGQTSAKIAGLNVATGDYVICIDSDDWVEQGYLEEYIRIIKEFNPDIINCCYYDVINGKKRIYKLNFDSGFYKRNEIESDIFPNLIYSKDGNYFYPTLCNKAIKTNLFKTFQIKVPNSIILGEDRAVSLPCLASANSLYITDKAFYCYRLNEYSICNSLNSFKIEYPLYLYYHLKNVLNIQKYDFKEQLQRMLNHDICVLVLSQFRNKNSYKIIKNRILKILKIDLYNQTINNTINIDFKTKICLFLLKYRIILPLYLIYLLRYKFFPLFLEKLAYK